MQEFLSRVLSSLASEMLKKLTVKLFSKEKLDEKSIVSTNEDIDKFEQVTKRFIKIYAIHNISETEIPNFLKNNMH